MKNRPFVFNLIQEHEGLRLKPYYCSAGYLTIGFGRNLQSKGISHKEAVYMLDADIKDCVDDLCKTFPCRYNELNYLQQAGLISMRFQLGPGGFRGFKKMIDAVREGDMKRAVKEALDSKWAKIDTPERAQEMARLLESK